MRWISLLFLLLCLKGLLTSWKMERERAQRVCGIERCFGTPRNPSAQSSVGFFWERPAKREPRLPSIQSALRRYFDHSFQTTPTLLAFEKAVWLGDLKGLPAGIFELYRDLGLLGILALSGQHVFSLVLVVKLLLFVLPGGHRHLPLLCAAVLFLTSGGSPSMLRTFAMAAAFFILRRRRLFCSSLQILFSSTAVLIAWDPALLRDTGFLLSVFGTLGLLVLFEGASVRNAVRSYVLISLFLPLWFFPIAAYFFGRLAIFAPVASILLSWFWDLVLIPVGFLVPLVAAVPGTDAVIAALDLWLTRFFAFQHGALGGSSLVLSTIRPTEIELVVLIFVGLCIAEKFIRK